MLTCKNVVDLLHNESIEANGICVYATSVVWLPLSSLTSKVSETASSKISRLSSRMRDREADDNALLRVISTGLRQDANYIQRRRDSAGSSSDELIRTTGGKLCVISVSSLHKCAPCTSNSNCVGISKCNKATRTGPQATSTSYDNNNGQINSDRLALAR